LPKGPVMTSQICLQSSNVWSHQVINKATGKWNWSHILSEWNAARWQQTHWSTDV